MPDAYDFDIPEMNRIGSLMRDLMEDAPVARKASPVAPRKPAARSKPKGPRGGKRLGSFPLRDFLGGVNWTNAIGHQSPLSTATATSVVRSRLGALTVATFIEGSNWRNALDGPQLITTVASATADLSAGPPPSVEDFFNTMTWE